MGCACARVNAYLSKKAKSAEKRRLHELAALRDWGAREWLDHFGLEEGPDGFLEALKKNPKTAPTAKILRDQHDAFRRIFAQGRMPSKAALMAHAMLEERAFVEAGLDVAA